MKRLRFEKWQKVISALTVVVVIGFTGVFLQWHSRAGTRSIGIEPEANKIKGGSAVVVGDHRSSGGRAVKFKAAPPLVADVLFDSLAYKGSLQATMNTVPATKSIGFGAKTYYLVDFHPTLALSESQSMIGSGIDKTIIEFKKDSSTHQDLDNRNFPGPASKGVTDPLRLILSTASLIQDLTILGNEPQADGQGNYHGLRMDTSGAVVRRVKIKHIPGSGQANPQETFSLNVYRANNVTIDQVIIDGDNVAASLLANNNASNTTVTNTELSNMTLANAIAWNTSTNGTFTNLYIHDVKRAFNFERETGTVTITRPKLRNIKEKEMNIANDQRSSVFNIIDPDMGTDPKTGKRLPFRIHIMGFWGNPTKQLKSDVHIFVAGKEVTNDPTYVKFL